MKASTTMTTLWAGALFALTLEADAADLHVPADYFTIQAAVDAATDGDTVHIAPGVYVEQVTIQSKNLTLAGQPGTILRAFKNMADTGTGFRTVILIRDASDVVLQGLTIEGEHVAECQPPRPSNGEPYDMRAIYFANAGGAVETCRLSGFRYEGVVTEELRSSVLPIVIFNQPELGPVLLRDLRISGCTIVDCYNGIWIQGERGLDGVNLNVTIENNAIQGVGPTVARSSNQPLAGLTMIFSVKATVRGNTFAGFSHSGEGAVFPFNIGILAYRGTYPNFVPAEQMRFENNTFRDNDVHLSVFKADGLEVVDNRFEGTGVGDRRIGIQVSGEGVEIRGNEFRDIPTGILGTANDPDYQTNFGVLSDGWIIDNRFRDVATPVELQSGATAAVEGTLIHPFPPPDPTFEKAVLITWPAHYGEWLLQCSADMENWSILDLPIVRQDDRLLVAVPADEDHEFFRLVEPGAP